jgi:ribosome-associated toxin RatA of RatAB toxin-antitoxin module
MPSVSAELTVAAEPQRVYAIARDVARYPEFMENVLAVHILEQTPERQVSRWESIIREFNRTITWTEVDYWDEAALTCRWESTDGDFERFDGNWWFRAAEDGKTQAGLRIDYEYNVPLIGALIQRILKKKMQENVESMLAAIKSEAEG